MLSDSGAEKMQVSADQIWIEKVKMLKEIILCRSFPQRFGKMGCKGHLGH